MPGMWRYLPDDPRSTMAGYEGSLTPQEETAVEQLTSAVENLDLQMVQGDYGDGCLGGDHAVEPLRLLLLRFLRGNAFSVSKALAQLTECAKHRAYHPVDVLLNKSPREVLGCDPQEFDSYYPRWLMGFDRLGRPIVATQYGSLRLWEMTKLTTLEKVAQIHAREQELLLRVLRRRSLRAAGGGRGRGAEEATAGTATEGMGEPGSTAAADSAAERPHIVDSVVVVVDTAELTLRHVTKDFVRLFKMRAQADQLLYPEMLGKIFIVNTPSLFSYVWTMFSPMVDARTRSKIAIISKPADWMAALREIADADQLSPEYGGTGLKREELPSLSDALFAAGSAGDVATTARDNGASRSSSPDQEGREINDSSGDKRASLVVAGCGSSRSAQGMPDAHTARSSSGRRCCDTGPAGLNDCAQSTSNTQAPGGGARVHDVSSGSSHEIENGCGIITGADLRKARNGAVVPFGDHEEVEETGDSATREEGWFSRSWRLFGGWSWSGQPGVARSESEDKQGASEDGRDFRATMEEEEYFDALTELDYQAQRDSWDGQLTHSMSSASQTFCGNEERLAHSGESSGRSINSRNRVENDKQSVHFDVESGRPSGNDDNSSVVWRRSWGGAWVETKSDTPNNAASALASFRTAEASQEVADVGARVGATAGVIGENRRTARVIPCVFSTLGWCYKPALRRLGRKSMEQLARWLCIANALSAMLAVASIVVGTFSVSTSWSGAVLGWQFAAITAVCLGSLLLLLALMGSAGARLRNRYTLLGFAALEGVFALGTLLMAGWCLALASGSARVSDLTWETLHEERNPSVTKEQFLEGARDRLVALGWSGIVLSIYSLLGPCVLAVALSSKIRLVEAGDGAWSDGERRFGQLKRWFHETNGLLTAFAFVCTGYGGYALSFTISLGLAANATSTYLMLAGGYVLILAGAVGAWAAVSARPDAFLLYFGALLPAGALYGILTIVQLMSSETSNADVEQAWPNLDTGGEGLLRVQARVRTMLTVCGVLSAVTLVLVVAAVVASWVTRKALLELEKRERSSFANNKRRRLKTRLSRGEKLAAIWALALAASSTFLDGSFAVFSAWLASDREQSVWLVGFWRAMGRGDKRYVEGDTFVVATAIIAAAVIGPGALVYAWSVYCRKGFRFAVGILVCTASLYTQVLRYVTKTEGETDSSSSAGDSRSGSDGVFIAATVVLAILQVAGPSAVLLYNTRRMTKRVHAAEVQYRALLLENGRRDLGGGGRVGMEEKWRRNA